MADYKDDKEEEFEIEEPNDSDFAYEKGKSTTCVIQRLLCNQKTPNTIQRYQIFIQDVWSREKYATSTLTT